MLPQQSAQQLLHQISDLDEAIGEPISQNISAKILLHLFVEQNSENVLKSDELNKMIDAPTSTFDRYIKVLASEGLIEMSQADMSEPAALRLSDSMKKRLATVFLSPE